MTQYSFDEVIKMDQALHQLAAYEVTHGMIIVPKTQEEFLELSDKIAKKFNYFKTLIRNKECNFQFIKDNVLQKNGPFPKEEKFDSEKLEPGQLDDVHGLALQDNNLRDFALDVLKEFLPIIQKDDKENVLDQLGIKIIVEPIALKNSILPAPSKKPTTKSSPKKRNHKKPHPKKE